MNLFPPAIAAALQKKVRPMTVAKVGPRVHATLALVIMTSPVFPGFAVPALFFVGVMAIVVAIIGTAFFIKADRCTSRAVPLEGQTLESAG